jgi:pSer/pThr/pTyr-binding forkhead associated (FHA) protein
VGSSAKGTREIGKVPGMVVCPWCGKSSPSTTHCVSCGAKFPPAEDGAISESQTPGFASFVTAINREWPDLQLDSETGPMAQVSDQPIFIAPTDLPAQDDSAEVGHVLVRLKPEHLSETGNNDEYVIDLTGQDVIVGRLPTCEICLDDDPLVSRYHANLSFRDGVYVLADMGSSNGTYLNDAPVTEDTILQSGDEINVGIHEILVRRGHNFPEQLRRVRHHPDKAEAPTAPNENTDPGLPEAEPETAGSEPVDGWVSAPKAVVAAKPTSPPMPETATPRQPEVESPFDVRQLDMGALQSQLEDIARVLGRQAAEEARIAGELRKSLESARATLAKLLATELEPLMELFSPDLGDLVDAAQQAAENPRHVDYVTALAARAGTIATTLEALQRMQSQTGLLANLRALYAELDAALE